MRSEEFAKRLAIAYCQLPIALIIISKLFFYNPIPGVLHIF